MKQRILVIDDEASVRDSLKMILEYDGYECVLAPSGRDGLAAVERDGPDLVFLDVKMPGMDGIDVLRQLRVLDESIPIVMISGHGTVTTAVEATKLGAFDFLEKPLSTERVTVTIRNALDKRRLVHENRRWRKADTIRHEMVGQSAALARVAEEISRSAPVKSAVLIQGESGVGKELVARAIHQNSPRARERFVQVNCAAIPDDLIESELFGHEKGSFTGATEKQIGKFEQADRGTIFLDEVGDMSVKAQAKVLRVLQEGEVERLGSSRTIKVDVRVLAATNKDLEHAISDGEFREDLFFRLSVLPIRVPSLRERSEDVAELVRHFAGLFARDNNFRTKQFSDAALTFLASLHWRGNIRELRNSVERLLVMTSGPKIDLDNVRAVLPLTDRSAAADLAGIVPTTTRTLREFKEASERAFLVGKLRALGWNISKTAEEIDTPRSNLYKKLEQYKIGQETDA
jgi:two-component system nitrogen regulation response regulator NtrX